MKSLVKIAAAALVALLPGVMATPANAVAYNRLAFSVDCVIGETGEDDHVIKDSDVLKVTFANCDGLTIADLDDTGNATMPDGTVLDSTETQLVSGNSFVVTVVGEADLEVDSDEDVDVYVAGTIDDPSSTLLATRKVTIGLSPQETMIREEAIGDPVGDDGSGDVYIAANPACQVEPGLHVYKTLTIEITEAGQYDFRAIAVNPIDEDLNWGVDKYPSSDPFLAVYETFDPALPETGVVGCNDDGDDSGIAAIDDAWWIDEVNYVRHQGLETESGKILHDQWPWFQATLDPGSYTLVYMPFSTVGTADFDLGQYGPTSDNNPTAEPDYVWEPKAQSVTFEMWGPQGGITIAGSGGGSNGPAALASTGVEPTFALWTATFMIGSGAAIMVARRRRETRV